MTKLKKMSPKRLIAMLIAIILVADMFPVSSLSNVLAAVESVFTVEIDNSISGDILVKLTNSADDEETKIEPVIDGIAKFIDFVDIDNSYNIEITGMTAYDDFYAQDVSFSGSSISFTPADFSIKDFSIITNHDEAGLNGTITPGVSAPYGENISITAKADDGYQIASFAVDGTQVPDAAGLEEYTKHFDNINASHTVYVTFVGKTREVTFTFNPDGSVSGDGFTATPEGGKIVTNEGASPSFTATANTNYHISSVTIDGEEKVTTNRNTPKTFGPYTFSSISRNHEVKVVFAIDTFEIAASVTGEGSIMINDNAVEGITQEVEYNDDLSFVIVPDSENGCVIDAVYINGEDIVGTEDVNYCEDGEHSVYTFKNVSSDHTIHVVFSQMTESVEDASNLFDFEKNKTIDNYIENGVHVYILKNNTTLDFFPISPTYKRIKINNERGNGEARRTIIQTTLISSVQVNTKNSGSWKKRDSESKTLDIPILIIIDKTAPVVADIPPMEWTNQNYTVSGTVTDENTTTAPSSGLSRVVWSKTSLSAAQALAETTNTVPISPSGAYSFTITEEQNNEAFYVYAIDKADNVSAAKTINIKIDKTPPEITGFHFQKIEPPVVAQVINFLTFGTYYNDEIEVVITARDTGISSGLKEITLYSDGVAVETKEVAGPSATFTLTLADFNESEISASVKDIAGNESVGKTKPTDDNVTTNAFSDAVSLKTEKPVISIAPTSGAVYTNGNEKWYDSNVGFNVTVDTESGGIFSVVIKVNGQTVTIDKNGEAIDANFFETKTLQKIFTVNTDANPVDGENTIEVIAVNNFGNEETASTTVYIDTTNPEIVGFSITRENGNALSKTLNFLTFGIFFNGKVKVTVITDDRDGATSGVNTMTLYADGVSIADSPKSVTAVGDGTFEAEFILPVTAITGASKHLEVLLSAVATDNVGNITGKDADNPNGNPVSPNTINSDILNSKLMIETVPPAINIESPDAVYSADGKNWYPGDVPFTVTAGDADSGIRSVEIKINGESITTDKDGKSVDVNFYLAQTHEEIFKINSDQGERNEDGSYIIEVTVVDNAGNAYSVSDIVYKDIDDPYITRFEFIPETSDGISETSKFIDVLEYGFYFKTEFTANIHVGDPHPSSGLAEVAYRFVSYENGEISGETTGTQKTVNGIAPLSIPKGFKGQIFVEVFDNVGNKSGKKTPHGFVIDDLSPEIDIVNNTATSQKDADGNKLYVTDMSFTVTVSDYGSGIKEIGYSQSAEQESVERKAVSVNNTGYKVGDQLEDGWVVAEMDFNLVTKVVKTFTFTSDDNDIVLTFDATDCSKNKTENVHSEKITIDKTAPIINVVFRAGESKNGNYYDANRIADITVIERNFDQGLIIAVIENTFGGVPAFSFTSNSNTEHVAVINFDEGDYTFDMHGTDLGNHTAVVNFSGGNENLFFVDKTKPVLEENFIKFSNAATDDSFNTDVTATIKITEHNFDLDSTNLKITRKDAGEPHNTTDMVDVTEMMGGNRWESQGDIHTLSITFDFDAVYQVEIMPMDLAGNTAGQRSTVVFEIDKTQPIVISKNGQYVSADDTEFLDIYPYSRKDDPAPTVEFEDLNIDHIRYSLTAYIPDYTNGIRSPIVKPVRVYLDEDEKRSGIISGNLFTLPNFTEDGVYAVELIAVDKAGNESDPNLNTYVRLVDSDVLAYISNSNFEAKTGWYSIQYENGDTISKKPDNFSDIEIVVFANKDTGRDIVLRDNNGDEKNTNLSPANDDSMYGVGIYNYTLKGEYFKENFQDDIDIEWHLAVRNEDNRIDLGRLHIDNVEPVATLPRDLRSWQWYVGGNNRTITITNISEWLDERKCKVYNNGKEIDFVYSSEDGTLVFTLDKGWHSVGIVLSDMAGNTNNIREKVNIHIGFFWLWVIMASSAALICAIGFIVMRNIKKKQELENE